MTWKSIIQALGVFGLLSHTFLSGGLIAVGYFDSLHLESAVISMSTTFHDPLSLPQSTGEPIVQAMESASSTVRAMTSVVLSTVKLLARISLASLSGYAVLFVYTLSRPATSKTPRN
jgi:hypothetical protein